MVDVPSPPLATPKGSFSKMAPVKVLVPETISEEMVVVAKETLQETMRLPVPVAFVNERF